MTRLIYGNNKGQIAVFLSVVLMTIVILVGILVDAVRIRMGEVHVKRALDSSIRSTLADYNGDLRDEYGIFALKKSDPVAVKTSIEKYLNKNLLIDKKGLPSGLDVYDFRIDSIQVTPVFNHAEYEVTRRQIFEYMKYRAPKELIEGVLDKFKAVREASKISEAQKKKLEIDKLMEKISKYQKKLNLDVNGTDGKKTEMYYVNKFREPDVVKARNNETTKLSSMVDEYKAKMKELKDVNDKLSKIPDTASQNQSTEDNAQSTDNTGNTSTSSQAGKSKTELEKKQKELMDALRKLREDSNSSIKKSISDLSQGLIKYAENNKNAVEYLNEIVRLGKEVREKIDGPNGLKNYANKNLNDKNSSDTTRQYKAGLEEDFKRIEKLIPTEGEASDMTVQLNKNAECMNEYQKVFIEIYREVELLTVDTVNQNQNLTGANIKKKLEDAITGYRKVSYGPGAKKDSQTDDRQNKEDTASKDLQKRNQKKISDKDIRNMGFKVDALPSKQQDPSMYATPSFEQQDQPYRESHYVLGPKGTTGVNPNAGIPYEPKIESGALNEENPNGGEFASHAYQFMGTKSTLLDELFNGVQSRIEDIYVNEYIMGTFKCAVPSPESSGLTKNTTSPGSTNKGNEPNPKASDNKNSTSKDKNNGNTDKSPEANKNQNGQQNEENTGSGGINTKKDLDLRGVEKKSRTRLLDYEVEYILNGYESQNRNKTVTELQIFGIRFVLDTISVYADSKERIAAYEMAAAVSWWTGGAGIPIIANLILCGKGLLYAIEDTDKIMDGKAVAFFRMTGQSKNTTEITFNYHDYLRLLLFFEGTNNKIARIQDLIELNLQYKEIGKKLPKKGKDGTTPLVNAKFSMANCKTYIRVEAKVSMKYFFLTQPFMPAKYKSPDGRHSFSVVVYQGY
ncbi:MAG: DUF5702 domain-containing protein [Clostridia bacterium]|nr:DUF5702 domain-containing protein [Clostridia bacterium]